MCSQDLTYYLVAFNIKNNLRKLRPDVLCNDSLSVIKVMNRRFRNRKHIQEQLGAQQ